MNERENTADSRISEITKKNILTTHVPRYVIVKLPKTRERENLNCSQRWRRHIQKDEDNYSTLLVSNYTIQRTRE